MTNEHGYHITKRPAVHSLVASWLSPADQRVWVSLTVAGKKPIPGLRETKPGIWNLRVNIHWLTRDDRVNRIWFVGKSKSVGVDRPSFHPIVMGMLNLRRKTDSWLIVPDELCEPIPDEPAKGPMSPQSRVLMRALDSSMILGLGIVGEMLARSVIAETFQSVAKAAE